MQIQIVPTVEFVARFSLEDGQAFLDDPVPFQDKVRALRAAHAAAQKMQTSEPEITAPHTNHNGNGTGTEPLLTPTRRVPMHHGARSGRPLARKSAEPHRGLKYKMNKCPECGKVRHPANSTCSRNPRNATAPGTGNIPSSAETSTD